MTNQIDYNKSFRIVCRVCSENSTNLISLFGIRKKGLMLADMLSICTRNKIQQTDNRPLNICSKCLLNLEIAFDFYNLVKSSEDKFQRIVANSEEEAKSQNINSYVPEIDCIVVEHLKVAFDDNTEERLTSDQPKSEHERNAIVKEEDEVRQIGPKVRKRDWAEVYQRRRNSLFECFLCKKKMRSFTDTRDHLKGHNEATPYKCDICAMKFSAAQFEQHLCKGQSVQCVYCSEEFRNTKSLVNHLECHREQTNFHKCPHCTRVFPMFYLMECHKGQHRPVEKPHVCHVCNRSFRIAFLLKKHLFSHSEERPHLCSTCGMGFKTMGTLRSHTIRHSGNRPFACSKCPKRFFCNAHLRKHMDVHSDAKYVCNLCDAILSSKRSLDEHRRHRHRKAEEQMCDLCSMKFRTIYNLKRHLLTHTGEKPHKCKFCERAFAQSGDLNKHLRSHVGEKTYQCEVCFKSFRLQIELRKHSYEHFQNESENKIEPNIDS